MDKSGQKKKVSSKPGRKRRKNNETDTNLSKEELRAKLRAKLRSKQTARLSRHSRENMMDNIENRLENAKGKEAIKLKRQLKELVDIEEHEMNNDVERTIPDYD